MVSLVICTKLYIKPFVGLGREGGVNHNSKWSR